MQLASWRIDRVTQWLNGSMGRQFRTVRNESCFALGMNTAPSRANQLERRLISFAAAIVSLSSKLPRTPRGRHICGQILRSGTSAAANYGGAPGAESRADFIHKLKVVFKGLNETTRLEVIGESCLLSQENIVAIVAENRELCRIIAASIKTARGGQND